MNTEKDIDIAQYCLTCFVSFCVQCVYDEQERALDIGRALEKA
jgi:hypothetical protein